MNIEIKDLYKIFVNSVKNSEYYGDWKKFGLRKFKKSFNDFELEIEIERMMSSPKYEHISLMVGVRIPSNIKPIKNLHGKDRKEGELLYRWNAKISKGVGRRTGAAGREWLIYNEMDIQNYSEELDQSVNELLPSFIGSISTIEDLLEYINENENILDRLPLILTIQGKKETFEVICNYIKVPPESRPFEILWDWCLENQVLTEDLVKRLKRTCIQERSKYIDGMSQIHNEIA